MRERRPLSAASMASRIGTSGCWAVIRSLGALATAARLPRRLDPRRGPLNTCYIAYVRFPVDRRALALRNQLDEHDEALQATNETPGARLSIALELSDLTRQLAASVGNSELGRGIRDLEQKATFYANPLRRLGNP